MIKSIFEIDFFGCHSKLSVKFGLSEKHTNFENIFLMVLMFTYSKSADLSKT